MPLNRENCGPLSILAQLNNANLEYRPADLRRDLVYYFCEKYEENEVGISLALAAFQFITGNKTYSRILQNIK